MVVFWGLLHRMILAELLRVFCVALVVLTGLILLAGVISEAMKSGFGPAQVLASIPLLLPSLLPYTVPTTTLFATCIVYGRLAADNEILALKAAGIHVIHVIWPAAFLGLITTAATMCLYLDVIPYTSYLLKARLADDVEEVLYTILRRDGCIRHPKLNYEINVKNIEGRKLREVIFKRRASDGKTFDTIAIAKEAVLNVDLDQKRILVHMRHCQLAQKNNVGVVHDQVWPVDIPDFLASVANKTRASDMTWRELFQHERKFESDKEKISRDIDLHQVAINLGTASAPFHDHVLAKMGERRNLDGQLFAIDSEFHLRPALALGCLCFALIGCPVGIWFSKSDYLSAFITCFLPIVVVYYPLMFCTINYARAGKIPPVIGIHDANIAMLVAAGLLFRKLMRN